MLEKRDPKRRTLGEDFQKETDLREKMERAKGFEAPAHG